MRSAAARIAYSAILLTLVATAARAQDGPPPPRKEPPAQVNPCPQVSLNGVGGRIFKDGERISLSVNVAGGDANVVPNFVWTTSAGVIESGQGTRNITIDSTGSGNDRQMHVDVWVGGYAPECTLQSNAAIRVIPPPMKIVEFGELTPERESEQLTEFVSRLLPTNDNIYVFGYAGRKNPRGFANVVLKRIKAHLIASGLAYDRLAFIDGGYREDPAFEIWMVPVGAEAPRPKPTVAAKDIVFPKTTPATTPKKP